MASLIDPSDRQLGSFTVPALAFGCWRFVGHTVGEAAIVLNAALDAGMTLVDTADVYGFDWGGDGFGDAEQLLGQVLAADPTLRSRMVLASKGGIMPPIPYDSSAEYLRAACEASLERLQIDTIDVYQIHRPDMYTHPAEVAATLSALKDEGKIVEVGVSNHTPAQHAALAAHLPFPIAGSQIEYSAHHLAPMRDGTLDLCMQTGAAVMAWSPLAGGRLVTGEDMAPDLLAVLDRLAEREGVDRATVATAFVLAHPSRPIAVVGTQSPDRIAAAGAALTVNLDRNDCYDIIEASEGASLP
jgi:predicted oxidoreductase